MTNAARLSLEVDILGMEQKKEVKIDKAELQNLIYPIMFGVVMVISLIIFSVSLRFLLKHISKVLFMDEKANNGNTIRFQDENIKTLKRYLPDAPQ